MSQIIELKSEGLEKHFQISIPASVIKDKTDQKVISLTARANMPGFRKFKSGSYIASKAMQVKQMQVRRQYEASIRNDVQNDVIVTAVESLIKSNNFSLIGDPSIKINDDFSIEVNSEQNSNTEEKDITVDVKFTVYPEIKIPDFSQITLKKHVIQCTEESVNEFINGLRNEVYEYKDCSEQEKAIKGSKLVIDIAITGDGIEDHNKEDIEFILGSGKLISKDIEERFTGSIVGSQLDISTTLPDNYSDSKAAGKLANLRVTVKKIQQPVLITEQQILDKYKVTSIDELKVKVKELQNKEFMGLSQILLRARLLNQLDKMLDYDLPKQLLKSEYTVVRQNVLAALKGDNNGIKVALDKSSDQDIEQYCQFVATRRVRIGLFVLHYADKKNITVTDEEKNMLLLQYLNKGKEEANAIMHAYNNNLRWLSNSIAMEAKEIKVINHILENEVQIIEEPCTSDEIEGFADEISKDMGLNFTDDAISENINNDVKRDVTVNTI
ncbi:trigger factor [Orientia tsutsugamushi]|uniref:trigger factor n=1 Tax=Orientia tsutsugamushi TaxID=784 RepID=UPI003526DF16